MPDLWSPEIMKPTRPPRGPTKAVVVPRERVAPKPVRATDISQLAAARERERQVAIAEAWVEGFRAAELVHGVTVEYALGGAQVEGPRKPTLREICEQVADKHRLKPRDLTGPMRFREFVRARHEAFYLAIQAGHWSTPQIGRYFGNRDHATVIAGAEAHVRRLAENTKGEGT